MSELCGHLRMFPESFQKVALESPMWACPWCEIERLRAERDKAVDVAFWTKGDFETSVKAGCHHYDPEGSWSQPVVRLQDYERLLHDRNVHEAALRQRQKLFDEVVTERNSLIAECNQLRAELEEAVYIIAGKADPHEWAQRRDSWEKRNASKS